MGTGGLVWVAVTAAAYLLGGLIVFRVLERITKVLGALAAYSSRLLSGTTR